MLDFETLGAHFSMNLSNRYEIYPTVPQHHLITEINMSTSEA